MSAIIQPFRPVASEVLAAVGKWFLSSGIQEPSGGVARYHRVDLGRNLAVSTEITGYAVSALCELYNRGAADPAREAYLDAARRAARFLVSDAWMQPPGIWPFELATAEAPNTLAYFFDTGIIIRGLLSLWRVTGEAEWLEAALRGGESLEHFAIADGSGVFHPVIRATSLEALPYEPRWSREPGCYQLKSAMAWLDLAEAQPEHEPFRARFEAALESALETADVFLPAATPEQTMDRLHAFSYFLEALTRVSDRPLIRMVLQVGIARVSTYLREIRDHFERSDVNAQLLRVRLLAAQSGAVSLNLAEAREEADRLRAFQAPADSSNPALAGGFAFGRRGGELIAHSNPVSAAFGLQALAMWDDYHAGIRLNASALI